MNGSWYAVVPARAGSVGVQGKNRLVAGESSLIEQAIGRALIATAGDASRVIVTTDDEFCSDVAAYAGCTVVQRPPALAESTATIADTVHHAVTGRVPDGCPVAVFQPTSPTLLPETIQAAIAEFEHRTDWDSLATATVEGHLLWKEDRNGNLSPVYSERVNRQDQKDTLWKETGGIMLVREWTGPDCLVSGRHFLWPLFEEESIDIDTPLDLVTARSAMGQRTIEWRIVAGQSVGYGHVYRTLALAAEMPHHVHRWIVDGPEEARILVGNRYPVAAYGQRYETAPDVVVFDCLRVITNDTEEAERDGALCVGIELMEIPFGFCFDLYLDELAHASTPDADAYAFRYGPKFASTRDEFRAAHTALDTGAVDSITVPGRVLVTFGGEDPERATETVLEALSGRYDLRAVIGPGFSSEYAHRLRSRWPDLIVETSTFRMSREMLEAQIVITGCGRTVWEAAYLGCSLITIPVNEREQRHAFPAEAMRIPLYDLDAGSLRLLVDMKMHSPYSAEERRFRSIASGIDGHGARRVAWLFDGMIGGLV